MTADTTLDAVEIELDLSDFEQTGAPSSSSSRRGWPLLTYPLIAAISAFAAVGILQIGPKGLWDHAQGALHVGSSSSSSSSSASSSSSSEVVSTPLVVRPGVSKVRASDERVARVSPRSEEHALRKHATPVAAAPPVAPPVVSAAPVVAAAPVPAAPPARAKAPTTSLGISGAPNADDVAAANAILQKAKSEHSF